MCFVIQIFLGFDSHSHQVHASGRRDYDPYKAELSTHISISIVNVLFVIVVITIVTKAVDSFVILLCKDNMDDIVANVSLSVVHAWWHERYRMEEDHCLGGDGSVKTLTIVTIANICQSKASIGEISGSIETSTKILEMSCHHHRSEPA